MKLVDMTCPNCGGTLELSEDVKQAYCPFCGSSIAVDDEIKHVQFDNTEQAGYNFERGRMRAQQDAVNARIAAEQARVRAQQDAERKRKNFVWWVIGWLFFFPIPLTILIAKSKKLNTVWKTVLIFALWGGILLTGILSDNNSNQRESVDTTAQIHIESEMS